MNKHSVATMQATKIAELKALHDDMVCQWHAGNTSDAFCAAARRVFDLIALLESRAK